MIGGSEPPWFHSSPHPQMQPRPGSGQFCELEVPGPVNGCTGLLPPRRRNMGCRVQYEAMRRVSLLDDKEGGAGWTVGNGVADREGAHKVGVEVVQTRPVRREEDPVDPSRRVVPPRCHPIWVSHGHTALGGAPMVVEWLVSIWGRGTTPSPGRLCRRSALVEPTAGQGTAACRSSPAPNSPHTARRVPLRSPFSASHGRHSQATGQSQTALINFPGGIFLGV